MLLQSSVTTEQSEQSAIRGRGALHGEAELAVEDGSAVEAGPTRGWFFPFCCSIVSVELLLRAWLAISQRGKIQCVRVR